jgi:hypothetical protein
MSDGRRICKWPMRSLARLSALALVVVAAAAADGHQSGCHRWHSCPSDTGSYVCGDLGYCSQCPDNQYCLLGRPRNEPAPAPTGVPTVVAAVLPASRSVQVGTPATAFATIMNATGFPAEECRIALASPAGLGFTSAES